MHSPPARITTSNRGSMVPLPPPPLPLLGAPALRAAVPRVDALRRLPLQLALGCLQVGARCKPLQKCAVCTGKDAIRYERPQIGVRDHCCALDAAIRQHNVLSNPLF